MYIKIYIIMMSTKMLNNLLLVQDILLDNIHKMSRLGH